MITLFLILYLFGFLFTAAYAFELTSDDRRIGPAVVCVLIVCAAAVWPMLWCVLFGAAVGERERQKKARVSR